MWWIIFALFVVVILLGLYLASHFLQEKETPKGIALIHGSLAALTLILLIVVSVMQKVLPMLSIAFFILAALVGFVLFYRDITHKYVYKWLIGLHALFAASGFTFLILFALKILPY